jgi:hypothetical protein
VEKTQMLGKSTRESDDVDRFRESSRDVLDYVAEFEFAKRSFDVLNDEFVGIGYPQYSLAETAFRVEYSGEKTYLPLARRAPRPRDEPPDFIDIRTPACANRVHVFALLSSLSKHEVGGFDVADA